MTRRTASSSLHRVATALGGLILSGFLANAHVVESATFNVDTIVDDPAKTACDDATADDCSLRGAVARANGDAVHDIVVVPTGTYTLSNTGACTFAAMSGDSFSNIQLVPLCFNSNLDVVGAGANETVIQSNGSDRVLAVSKDKTVAISGVTVSGGRAIPGFGYAIGGGGGILNHGNITLTGCLVTNNQAHTAGGGGIYSFGNTTLIGTTVTGNSTPAGGGGVANYWAGTPKTLTVIDSTISTNSAHIGAGIHTNNVVVITGSTISGNTANVGGGIAEQAGHVTIVNSTISGNSGLGAGLDVGRSSPENASYLRVVNSTITKNTSTSGGGFYITGNQPVTLLNTIVAGNTSSQNFGPDCAGTFTSEGYNLIGNTRTCVIAGDTSGNVTDVDARLGDLADNGGPTRTHAPLAASGMQPASPAIDAGNPAAPGSGGSACAASDQRGVVRPIGVRCDIGAFERSGALALFDVAPTEAGNEGPIAAIITGSGFEEGATVKLVRPGESDIPGTPVNIESAGASLATSFDLTGRALGAWDVVVTNPGGGTVTLAGAFTVEATEKPKLWADLIARSAVRAGVPVRFAVVFGNRGNVDALGVPLSIIVPKDFTFEPLFGFSAPPAAAGQVIEDFGQVRIDVTTTTEGEERSFPFLLPIVPAGFTGLIDFNLTLAAGIAHGADFLLGVKIEPEPWIVGDTAVDERIDELVAGARAYAELEFGAPIPASVDTAAAAYGRAQLEAIGAAGRAEVVALLGQTRSVYSVAQLMIDVAAFMDAQATAATDRRLDAPTALARAFTAMLRGGLVAIADAETVCPPCIPGRPIPEGCMCGGGDKPYSPPPGPGPGGGGGGFTPGDCVQLPGHKVSDDGTSCIPKNTKKCPRIQNPFTTDPDCVRIPIRMSVDPNDKTAPAGSGPTHVVTGDEPLKYAIAFENLPAATAPAQIVRITDQLDTTSLDLSTFSLGPISIGADVTIVPPPGLADFTGGADLRPGLNIIVTVDAHLDPQTGIVTWTFVSLDPTTGQLTDDADAGFLPPNTNPPDGEGRVVYTISAKSTVATGTVIENQASIVFDVNAPIETPEVSNVIDKTAPTSAVTSAAGSSACDTALTVQWSGTDEGSAVVDYSIFVSENGGPFTLWQEDTETTSAVFQGEPLRTYAFYSVARDFVDNLEAPPALPDVTHTIDVCGDAHDLAITKLKIPKSVKLTDKKPSREMVVGVQIQNRGRQSERIPDVTTLASLVAVSVDSLGGCADPVAAFRPPKKPKAIELKAAKKLKLLFDVTIDCANDPTKDTADYAIQARIDRLPNSATDSHAADDVCPRDVTPPGVLDTFPVKPILDKGCGVKKPDKTFGGTVSLDVVRP